MRLIMVLLSALLMSLTFANAAYAFKQNPETMTPPEKFLGMLP